MTMFNPEVVSQIVKRASLLQQTSSEVDDHLSSISSEKELSEQDIFSIGTDLGVDRSFMSMALREHKILHPSKEWVKQEARNIGLKISTERKKEIYWYNACNALDDCMSLVRTWYLGTHKKKHLYQRRPYYTDLYSTMLILHTSFFECFYRTNPLMELECYLRCPKDVGVRVFFKVGFRDPSLMSLADQIRTILIREQGNSHSLKFYGLGELSEMVLQS